MAHNSSLFSTESGADPLYTFPDLGVAALALGLSGLAVAAVPDECRVRTRAVTAADDLEVAFRRLLCLVAGEDVHCSQWAQQVSRVRLSLLPQGFGSGIPQAATPLILVSQDTRNAAQREADTSAIPLPLLRNAVADQLVPKKSHHRGRGLS